MRITLEIDIDENVIDVRVRLLVTSVKNHLIEHNVFHYASFHAVPQPIM